MISVQLFLIINIVDQYINVVYGFVLLKFVKPYIHSVLFKTGSLHNTI